jgi:enoyl-CoA hydratase/carnithine racemase
MFRNLICEMQPPAAVLTLNRPERRNALSLELMEELTEALAQAGADPSVRAVILASSGTVFCSGHDLNELRGRGLQEYRRVFQACRQLMQSLRKLPQPVIAEVQGIAAAAGCQLVAACDLAVASEEAGFATPGVRIGLFCSTPMVPLTRAISPKRAFQMLVTGDSIDARTALAWGLVNRVVPAAKLRQETLNLAARIAEASPMVVALGKQAFYAQLEMTEDQAYAYASEVITLDTLTADAQEGIGAFLEKRRPQWSGC